jgi:protein TonB
MAAVASVLAMAPVAAIEDAETGGGRSIRRGGHLGRDGSVGSDGSLPEALANIPPVYPEIARQNGWAGTVSLRLWIGASGSVERLEVATSSGHAALDAAAVEAVRSWRFRPALRGGSPIAVTVLLPVVFDLKRGPGVSEISTSMSR